VGTCKTLQRKQKNLKSLPSIFFSLGDVGKKQVLTCSSNHPLSCHDCNEQWSLIAEIRQAIQSLNVVESEKAVFQQEVQKFEESLCKYISHLVKGKHQHSQF